MPNNKNEKHDSSSSSDSDDEDCDRLNQLKEAAVTFESINLVNLKPTETDKAKNSNRKNNYIEDNDEDLAVTPEFQEFVARKLKKKLDEQIELIDITKKAKKFKTESIDGVDDQFEIIKNLYFKECNIKKPKKKKKKVYKSDTSDDEINQDDMNMLKEAAVDLNFILNST